MVKKPIRKARPFGKKSAVIECPHCRQRVIPSKPGVCPSCLHKMDAPSPAPEPQPERGSVPLWTPKQVAYLSILTGFPTGLVLSSINWSRMGSAWTAAVYWIVGLIFLTLWTFIADGLLLAGINIAFSFVLYQQMKHDVGQFHREGYEITSRTWKSGCLVGVITVVVTVFLFVFILWLASAAS